MNNALHSAVTCEHGSPPVAVDLARKTLGKIDLDPFSSSYWNHYTVKAGAFYDRDDDGLSQSWGGLVFVNPPGGDRKLGLRSLVRPAWERLVENWRDASIEGGCWLSYSLEQLHQLQGSPAHPLQFPTVVFCERLDYMRRPPNGGPPKPGGSPTHGSAMTLLPSRRFPTDARAQLGRFLDAASKLGAVVRPAV